MKRHLIDLWLIMCAVTYLGCGADEGTQNIESIDIESMSPDAAVDITSQVDFGVDICESCTDASENECVPTTCSDEGAVCGSLPDGCGGLLECGPCAGDEVCGGGGVDWQCGPGHCTPKTCGDRCGTVGDGCGNTIECGSCEYKNMVLDSNGDPGCIRFQGTYYLYQPRATTGRVVAFTSKDLVHWKSHGEVFSNANMRYDGQTPSALWAPEVFHHNGKFYLYFVNRMKTVGNNTIENSDIAVVESTDPLNFKTGTPKVLLSDDYVFLDPSPFHDPNTGKLYLLFKRRTPSMSASEIRIRPMANPTRIGGEASTLVRGADIPSSRGIVEHPEIEERDGVYYFLFSYGHGAYADSYTIAYRTSKSGPTGGYGPVRTLFAPDESPNMGAPIWAPGASSVVRDGAGKDWLVYRQKTKAVTGFGDRQVAIDRIRFKPDENPPVIRGTPTRNVVLDAPAPLP